MSINIVYKNGEFHWELYDGPDGTDHFTGVAGSLGEAFENIIKQQLINSMKY